MADYIYMMESRLSPEQQRAVALMQEAARAHSINLYLTGGTIRDIISGFTIRDLDFTVEGDPQRLQRELEKAGAEIQGGNEHEILLQFAGGVRGAINRAYTEKYGKPGKAPETENASIMEDLRRRDFTVNSMALSLNPGSRGLLLDPTNGVADLEAKLLRVLHNYAFLEDPSRMIRASRFMVRFHWTMDERTQARYNAAVENQYIEHMNERAAGREIEQLAYEDEPLPVMRTLEKEGWLKALHPHWTVAKVDAQGLGQLLKTRQQMSDLGYSLNISPAVIYFLTARLSDRDIADLQKQIPRKGLVRAWQNLEGEAKQLTQRLGGKEAATPSRAWQLLSASKPDTIAFVETTARQQAVVQKIRNFFGKWRQMKQRFPLPEMTELRITPELPVYQKLVDEMFLRMLDGKLRSKTEIVRLLKPYSPPPPPPPPPPKRGRVKKEAEEAPVKPKVEPKAAKAKAAAGSAKAPETTTAKPPAKPVPASKSVSKSPKPAKAAKGTTKKTKRK